MQLTHPRCDEDIWEENNKKWKKVLNRYLVEEDTMLFINGGSSYCSIRCLDEEENKFQFVDTARFTLNNCQHASHHLQCILSHFIYGGGNTWCPIMDTPQCKSSLSANGEALYWAPEDYYNFARAFLRTKALTEVFLKPQFR